jgi:predicted  nucleic acid-binding Zn-ribbon protein
VQDKYGEAQDKIKELESKLRDANNELSATRTRDGRADVQVTTYECELQDLRMRLATEGKTKLTLEAEFKECV